MTRTFDKKTIKQLPYVRVFTARHRDLFVKFEGEIPDLRIERPYEQTSSTNTWKIAREILTHLDEYKTAKMKLLVSHYNQLAGIDFNRYMIHLSKYLNEIRAEPPKFKDYKNNVDLINDLFAIVGINDKTVKYHNKLKLNKVEEKRNEKKLMGQTIEYCDECDVETEYFDTVLANGQSYEIRICPVCGEKFSEEPDYDALKGGKDHE